MIITMRYLHRDPKTRNYIYRRSVPERLRSTLGTKEINRSLSTKDESVALNRWHIVNREIEELLHSARKRNSPGALQQIAAEHLRAKGFNPELGLRDAELSDIEMDLRVDYLDDLHDRDPAGADGDQEAVLRNPEYQPQVDLLIHGTSNTKTVPTLEEALEKFIVEKGRAGNTYARDKRWRDFHHRAVEVFSAILKDGTSTQLDKITRDDAIRWRDKLIAEDYAQETVKKHHTSLKALFQRMLNVLEINRRNPFEDLTIMFPRKQSSRALRDPFNDAEEALVLSVIPKMNREAQLVTRLMLCTGCRVTEACTLMREDIVLDANIPYIHIRQNERNEWNLKGSFARKVPVVDLETLELLREFPDGPGRYTKPGAAATCSTTINKVLRENGLHDGGNKVSLYSARHTLKKKLLAVQAPEYVIDEIMGHSDGKAKDSYGDGVAVEVTSKWLRAALGS